MKYNEKTTEQLETLRDCLNAQLDNYVGMPFPSLRSELVTYEIDSVDFDKVVVTVNHFFKGLIRDYTVSIAWGVEDDVEYNRYNADEEVIDGGYMSFERLPKILRVTVFEIYELYRELEKIDNILNSRAEEESEESEEEEVVETEEETEGEDVNYSEMTTGQLETLVVDLLSQFEESKEESNKEESKEDDKEDTMNRIDVYNAYTVDCDFRCIAEALGFAGFDCNEDDPDFKEKLENDVKLDELLEQFEDVESSQLLMYYGNTTDFYQKHEHEIISYLKIYGYDDDYRVKSIEDIMCSRVTAYVTGVLSEYGY